MEGFDQSYTRKRGAEEDDLSAEINRKRASLPSSGSENGSLLFKLLVPTNICGAILGKGGSILAQASQTTGTRIKLSQSKEFFPTTNDRVLAVSGPKENCIVAVEEFINRMTEALDKLNGTEGGAGQGTYTVRVLIPSPAAGVMIGRQGSVIKQLSESTGCKMQLGENSDPFGTKERIMIIIGRTAATVLEGVKAAMIQFFSEPGLAVYANPRTTYAQTPATMMGGQGMMPPMGAMMGMMGGMGPMMGGGGPTDHYGPAHGAAVGGGYSAYGGAPGSAPPPSGAGGGAVGYGKPEYGFPSQQASVATSAYHSGGLPQQSYSYQSDQSYAQVSLAQGGGYAGAVGAGSAPAPRAPMAMQSPGSMTPAAFYDTGLASLPSHDFTQPQYTTEGAKVVMEMGVADSRLGALLGRGGQIIKEIMVRTGANVHVSQKDVFIPGTTHRSVKATGTLDQIHNARHMIFTKLQEGLMSGGRR